MEEDSNARRRLLQKLAAAAAGGFTVQALARRAGSPDDAEVPPLLRANPEPLANAAQQYPVRHGEIGVVAPEFPYGHGLRHGIKTDGTDTTAEVKNWRDSILGMGTYADAYGLLRPLCKAVLPSGLIRVTEPGALLLLRYGEGPMIWGYVIEGDGLQTTVFYDPKTPGPLLFASNRLFGLVVRNISFEARDDAEPADWLRSESAGPQQYFTFENLGFCGRWRAGVRLSAPAADPKNADCNSEFKFDRINIGATFTDAFLCDAENDVLQSAQFLNYWLSNVNQTRSGSLVRLRRGGHVTITNLDVSGFKPDADRYLIDLPEIGGYSDDIHSLIVRNARFEPLSEHARFLRCRWERGTVVIDGYDDVLWRNTEHLCFDLRVSNALSDSRLGKTGEGAAAAGAQYWFANGRFTGIHRFVFRGTGDADYVPATIQYQNCEFCGPRNDPAARNIHSFVRLVPDGGTSMLLRPHLRFRACRMESAPDHVTDWDLGVQGPHPTTQAPIKALRFGSSSEGRLPSGEEARVLLAPGALVLRVTWIFPGGRAPSRPYRFELANDYDDDRREVLAVLEGDDLSQRVARVDLIAYETIPWPPPENFDAMRSATLVLRETRAPGVHPTAQCIVEYI